jgi:hypothetical protein
MCFSAEASFGVGVVLIPAGIYCTRAALSKSRPSLAVAAIPIFFGIQQCCEGLVWIGLSQNNTGLTRAASLAFLFFALAFWPFWIPLSTLVLEPQPRRRLVIGIITVLSLAWAIVLYGPIATDPERWLTVSVVHHSIQYHYFNSPIYGLFSAWWLRLFYLATIAAPLVICSERQSVVCGILFLMGTVVSYLFFSYAFISVWCFFGAVATFYLCWIFFRMERAVPQQPIS